MLSKEFLGEAFYMHSQRLNLGQLRSDVNVWWNLAPHDISILLFLMGGALPKSVSASGTAHLQPGIEDVVMASLVWEHGVRGFVHVSWLDPYKVRRLTIVGSQRMIVYDDVSDYKITVLEKGFDRVPRIGERMDFDAPRDFRFEPRQGEVRMPHVSVREPLQVEISHFFECITTGREPLTGPRHARDVVAILAAGNRSLMTGGHPIALDDPVS
jgi:predicted dehydrogenase